MTAPEKTQGERKNPNDMTLDECRNELARNAGWGLPGDRAMLSDGTLGVLTKYQRNRVTPIGEPLPPQKQAFDPIAGDLDEAAKLPEPWRSTTTIHVGYANTVALAFNSNKTLRTEGTTELLARFRLRVAVERATSADDAEGGAP